MLMECQEPAVAPAYDVAETGPADWPLAPGAWLNEAAAMQRLTTAGVVARRTGRLVRGEREDGVPSQAAGWPVAPGCWMSGTPSMRSRASSGRTPAPGPGSVPKEPEIAVRARARRECLAGLDGVFRCDHCRNRIGNERVRRFVRGRRSLQCCPRCAWIDRRTAHRDDRRR